MSERLVDIAMPKLSDSMEEAVIVRWLKREGESVQKGDPLIEVETDKATVVYEAESSGHLHEILAGDGSSAELGVVIARLLVPDATAAATTERLVAGITTETGIDVEHDSDAMAEIDFREAVRSALDEELARDERVILFGEDVAVAGGMFAASTGLLDKYGPHRVFDTPISELAMTGSAYGAAITGLRPIVEIMFGDFLLLSMDSLVNQITKYRFLTGGEVCVPLVIRSVVGGGGRFGAIHSQMPISWLMGIPGLKIVAPSTPADARGLLKAAIRDDDPVAFFEHKRLYQVRGERGCNELEPLGVARIARQGDDLTLVSAMKGVYDCLEAADALERHGVSSEVIDLRTIRPLDFETVLESVRKTHRIAVVEEGPLTGGWGGEVLALLVEHALDELEDAWRIATPDAPVPFSPPLEDAFFPNAAEIVRQALDRRGVVRA